MADTTNLSIRDAREADVPIIVAMLADDPLGRTRERPETPLPQSYWDAYAAIAADPRQLLLVAEHDGEVVGCMQVSFIPGLSQQGAERVQIEGVRVATRERNRGWGAQMIRYAIDLARARGCRVVQLTTNKSRTDAHRFYERLGFVASHVGMKYTLDLQEQARA